MAPAYGKMSETQGEITTRPWLLRKFSAATTRVPEAAT
jgi:hypothetical protein